ncbi:MAG: 2-isopropylmalate synthase [Clostridia bacterium]|nr:2-isopropylmalate synthase [Clostridia bacterium]
MKNTKKYVKQYYLPDGVTMDWMKKDTVEKAPIWCSVDLRDGNQALIVPMNLEEKLEFFKLLCKVGFKEIEIGFPAASETEYEFCRKLIEDGLIPDDVTIQVLTQAREHIIAKTFEALKGAKRAVVHVYNSTSYAQRTQVFKKEKQEILEIAVAGAKLCQKYKDAAEGKITFEYSPESFTGTEPQFAAEVCNAVLDVWKPTADDKAIINLPVTVEHSMPHVYANQVEYMCKNLHYRENVIVSLHPHNDRGCAIADSEMGLLAGGDRIEGTLFGNGERTGNVDIVTLALNMYSQGVDPQLDFSNLPEIIKTYEKVTRMRVYERQPYSGQLVFAAFSGSHQDAIAKGMKYREDGHLSTWTVPYLPLDPGDIGREYEADVIRINSQSGKGGIGYILETQYKLALPAKMREMFGYHVKSISDHAHKELSPKEVYDIFMRDFVNVEGGLKVLNTSFDDKIFLVAGADEKGGVQEKVGVEYKGQQMTVLSRGNGRFDCVCEGVRAAMGHVDGSTFKLESYTQHAIGDKSDAQAISYVCVSVDGKAYWGAGIDCDIVQASVKALASAINVKMREEA